MDVNASFVVSGLWREGNIMGRNLGEKSEKQLLPAPGLRGVAVAALGMEQGAAGGTGTASIFMQGPAPSPMQQLLTPFLPATLISPNSLI